MTFIDEFLTPEFAFEQKLFSFEFSERNDRYEIASREFAQVKEKLLFQLTNMGNPYLYVENANHGNRGELLLIHEHRGVDLRPDYSNEALRALHRLWKRPVVLRSQKRWQAMGFRYDGQEHSSAEGEA